MNNFNAYPCQIRALYIEETDNHPLVYSLFLDQTKSTNVAGRFTGESVSDEYILEDWRPSAFIKLTDNFSNAASVYDRMAQRFPNKEIFVVSRNAEYGSDNEKLINTLVMKSMLYPDAARGSRITETLLRHAVEELGIDASIYTR